MAHKESKVIANFAVVRLYARVVSLTRQSMMMQPSAASDTLPPEVGPLSRLTCMCLPSSPYRSSGYVTLVLVRAAAEDVQVARLEARLQEALKVGPSGANSPASHPVGNRAAGRSDISSLMPVRH